MKPFIPLHRPCADDSDIYLYLPIKMSNSNSVTHNLLSEFIVLIKIQGIDLRQRVTPKCMQ